LRTEVLRELSRSRTPVDRLRARATALAAAGMGVALLAAASIAGLRSTEPTGTTHYYLDETGAEVVEEQFQVGGGLAPFLAQDGLRPGTVLAAVLLVLPFTVLALQARAGRAARRRRLPAGVRIADRPAAHRRGARPPAYAVTLAGAREAVWDELTARSVALCRRDRERWRACVELSDRLERAGVDAPTAVRRALEAFGA
jgi:hypothetical protein